MEPRNSRLRTWAIGAAAGAAGLTLGLVGIAGAQTDNSSTSTTTPSSSSSAVTAPAPTQDQRPDPATMDHGPGETLLTGDTADKVTAAALEAVPGGTVIRVETDNEGSPYEAHVRKADGTEVTVKFDAGFNATETVDGFGHGPGGPHGPDSGSTSSGASA